MENHERVERKLLEQCSQVATLVECFAWLQRCDECIERLEELCCAKHLVYGIENKQVLPLRLTSDKKDKHVNLLYMQDPRDDGVGHFVWIKNLLRLVRSQITRKKNKKYFCDRNCSRTQWTARRSTIALFIELNTNFRTRAKNDFEKNLYKLMNNAIIGKTMENVRNHADIKLLTKWDGRYDAEAMIAKPNFHSCSVFAENLIAVELRKLEVKFDKPIYMGM
ncbi:hypothetical protein ALC56_04015 [Trachymyrmex septentrionalis]|uniref:Uncharacterized protein n=1 Tax=Trachymyrmex septentrionalis TaxID=34720 RepID=A0A151JYM2_9HYME|nr:hypothetical protein ALC56_04015 [Trachymyrmex septentrionalis]